MNIINETLKNMSTNLIIPIEKPLFKNLSKKNYPKNLILLVLIGKKSKLQNQYVDILFLDF